ncbi:flippase activity-associated protein Agl23 [Acidobacteriota bacterium]
MVVKKKSAGLPIIAVLLSLLILAATAVLRLYSLDTMPFHHDESIHAVFSLQVTEGDPYRYDPVYHGPLLYYTVGCIFAVAGDSDTTARIYPAICGILLVGTMLLFRNRFGPAGMITGMALLCFSPTLVYFSRFLRNDVPVAFLSLVTLAAIIRYFEETNPRWLFLAGLSGALALTSKEVTYIIAFQWFVGLLVVLTARRFRGLKEISANLLRHQLHLCIAILIAAGVFFLFFTAFFEHPRGLYDGTIGWIKYWWSQHETARIPGPWYYHILRIGVYDPWVLLICPLVTVILMIRRRSGMMLFMATWAWSSLALYSYLQEKVPWLMVHIIVPMVLLFCIGFDDLWRRSGRWLKTAATVAVLLFLILSLRSTVNLCFRWPADPREMLVFTQTSDDVHEAVATIRQAREKWTGEEAFQIVVQDEVGWPFAWYLRDLPTHYSADIQELRAPVILLEAYKEDIAEPLITQGYKHRKFRLRVWWEPAFRGVTLWDIYRYWIYREPFSSTGSYDFLIMLSPEVQE